MRTPALRACSEVAAAAASGGSESARWRSGAVEGAFWEAVCALSGEAEGRAPPAHVAEALEALAFDALLAPPDALAASTLAASAAAPLAPAPPAPAWEGERVARALGLLSRRRFAAVTARFLRELEARVRADSSAARAEVAALCRGLRHLHLPVSPLRAAWACAAHLTPTPPSLTLFS
jgi:hypothetical protein